MIATPEYNYSVPGVLKNAIDWASRPSGFNAFNGKPVAIIGASTGNFGTARSQYDLRKICVAVNMLTLNKPEVFISRAAERFDEKGILIDEETKKRIGSLLEALVNWVRKIKPVNH